jgi:hypothetical protein
VVNRASDAVHVRENAKLQSVAITCRICVATSLWGFFMSPFLKRKNTTTERMFLEKGSWRTGDTNVHLGATAGKFGSL